MKLSHLPTPEECIRMGLLLMALAPVIFFLPFEPTASVCISEEERLRYATMGAMAGPPLALAIAEALGSAPWRNLMRLLLVPSLALSLIFVRTVQPALSSPGAGEERACAEPAADAARP